MENKDKNWIKIYTKVSPLMHHRLEKISKKKGMSIYTMLQMMCDTLGRYMDDRYNMTPEMEKAMSIFEHLEGWSNALNLADPTVKKKLGEATYFFYDPKGNKKGVRAVHVMQPSFGSAEETMNIQDILERTVCLLMPERYSRLMKLADVKRCSSLVELIDYLIDEHSQDEDVEFFRQQFSARGITHGEIPYFEEVHKKTQNQNLQQTFDFELNEQR